jgi:uncharacterized protein YqhQ
MTEGSRGVARWPLVRGVMSLGESLRLGSEALRFSVDQLERDLEMGDAGGAGGAGGAAKPGGLGVLSALGLALFAMVTRDDGAEASERPSQRRAGSWLMLVIAVAFFVALPQGAAAGLSSVMHWHLDVQSPGFQALTGAFKLTVVVGYLLAIRRVAEIRRVFQYHGAEHKTISTYEAGDALTVENARRKTTLHPRCGTTFLVMVALVSILVFTAIGAALPRVHTSSALVANVAFFLEKLPFLPLIAGITFEIQRVFARYCTTGPLRALLWPGFLVQKITTAEPDDDQLEVALASLRVTLFRQEGRHATQDATEVSFGSYGEVLAADTL